MRCRRRRNRSTPKKTMAAWRTSPPFYESTYREHAQAGDPARADMSAEAHVCRRAVFGLRSERLLTHSADERADSIRPRSLFAAEDDPLVVARRFFHSCVQCAAADSYVRA